MLKLIKDCAPWLNWQTAGLIAIAALGITICFGAPAAGLLAGAAPLLLIIACLVPCLLPILAMRRKTAAPAASATSSTIPLSASSASCSCGQEQCSIRTDTGQSK